MKFLNGVMTIQLLQKMNMMPKLKKLKLFSILLCKKSINKLEEHLVVCLTLDNQEPEHLEQELELEQLELQLEELKMLNKLFKFLFGNILNYIYIYL
jgi:hypothetical protein